MRNPSKGTMKRKIIELMVENKKEGETSTRGPKIHILKFCNSEKVEGILNEIFPLVIIGTILNFDVSGVLIDGGSFAISCTQTFLRR